MANTSGIAHNRCLTPHDIKGEVGLRQTGEVVDHITVGCRKCPRCLAAMQGEVVSRLAYEQTLYRYPPLFLTLTYDDEHLNYDHSGRILKPSTAGKKSRFVRDLTSELVPSLNKYHLQTYLKRVRKELSTHKMSIRYMAIGEYGGDTVRPHYHLLIFGVDPYALESLGITIEQLFSSHWKLGHADVQYSNGGSLSYIGSYHSIRLETPSSRVPSFCLSSRQPGIGTPTDEDIEYIRKHYAGVHTGLMFQSETGLRRYSTFALHKIFPPGYYYSKDVEPITDHELAAQLAREEEGDIERKLSRKGKFINH